MDNERYSLINGDWMTCGCGGKPKVKAILPPNSKPLLIRKHIELTGPKTGIKYSIRPNEVSLDIDLQDYEIWSKDGTGLEDIQGRRGRLTRVFNDQKKQK